MSNNVRLNMMKTANGWYVEHEVDSVVNGYAVEGDDWGSLNPALVGLFDTPFTDNEEKENSSDKSEVTELKVRIKTLEEAEEELTALKEAAGGIDILQAIEAAKKAAETDGVGDEAAGETE